MVTVHETLECANKTLESLSVGFSPNTFILVVKQRTSRPALCNVVKVKQNKKEEAQIVPPQADGI